MVDNTTQLIELANNSLKELAKVNKRLFILAFVLVITLGATASFMWGYYLNKAYDYTEISQEVKQQDQNIKQTIK